MAELGPDGSRRHRGPGVDRRAGIHRGRGNRGRPRDQRRSGQTDGQAAATLPGRRRRASHIGEQCGDAGQSALPATARINRFSGAGHARIRPAASWSRSPVPAARPASTRFRTVYLSLNSFALHGISPDHVQGALLGGYFAGLLDRSVLDATLGPRDAARPRYRPGQRCDSGAHRRLPGRCRRGRAGVLRPRKCRPMRLLLQRDRGDGRRRRSTARRRRQRRGSGAVAPVVGGASRTRRMRDVGRRDQHRRQPAGKVSRARPTASRQRLPDMPSRCFHGRRAPTRSRR